jgi:hypothetical protein
MGVSPMAVPLPVATEISGAAAVTKVHAPDRQFQGMSEETSGTASLFLGAEANDGLAVMSNGAAGGEAAPLHTISASLLATGALAFQTNVGAPIATQVTIQLTQIIQIPNVPVANTFVTANSPQQVADHLFEALARWADVSTGASKDSLWEVAYPPNLHRLCTCDHADFCSNDFTLRDYFVFETDCQPNES